MPKLPPIEDKQLAYASRQLLETTNFRALRGLDIDLPTRFRP